jgi:hypothetical protein
MDRLWPDCAHRREHLVPGVHGAGPNAADLRLPTGDARSVSAESVSKDSWAGRGQQARAQALRGGADNPLSCPQAGAATSSQREAPKTSDIAWGLSRCAPAEAKYLHRLVVSCLTRCLVACGKRPRPGHGLGFGFPGISSRVSGRPRPRLLFSRCGRLDPRRSTASRAPLPGPGTCGVRSRGAVCRPVRPGMRDGVGTAPPRSRCAETPSP